MLKATKEQRDTVMGKVSIFLYGVLPEFYRVEDPICQARGL